MSTLSSFQLFASLRAFEHFAVRSLSVTSLELAFHAAPGSDVASRVVVDVSSDALVRVRVLAPVRLDFDVRRPTPYRVVQEIVAALQRSVPGFVAPRNAFQVDFASLASGFVPLSSPLERSLMAGALVHFLQPLVAADDAVLADVTRLVDGHFVDLQEACIGRRLDAQSSS
jgi:hypothetical protein